MRRFEADRNDTGGGRGFRIIEAGGRYLEPLTPPPPPRAPEPYKLAPSSSALGRAHRRSSFVIIAETRPTTPRSPSPSLPPTGRVSPFRGRGFKGPLPRARSRPRTPDERRRRIHGARDRRVSVSQQNSPKRSLIPQPTRRRSVSLTKNETSPKFGRRAVQRNLANGEPTRKHAIRAPDLSPIQGTPPSKSYESVARYRAVGSPITRVSPVKSTVMRRLNGHSRISRVAPGKPATTERPEPRRFVGNPSPEDDSKTRIPVRRGSLLGKNLPTSRFVGKNTTDEKKSTPQSKTAPETTDAGEELEGRIARTAKESPHGFEESVDSKHRGNDLGLMSLLKQSSGAIGTSSVVNTTTVTAVQPLQIDATAILLDREAMNGKGTNSSSPGSAEREGPSSTVIETAGVSKAASKSDESGEKPSGSSTQKNPTSQSSNANEAIVSSGERETQPPANRKNPSKVSSVNRAPSEERTASNEGEASKEKQLVAANGGSKKNLRAEKPRNEEARVPSANPGTREPFDGPKENGSVGDETSGSAKASSGVDEPREKSSLATTGVSDQSSKKPVKDAKTIETLGRVDNSKKTHRANGSENSLESLNGLSNVSSESARSTDTGVSLDTVRGVSSAREKRGLHAIKRSEEIETLSGNVTHLERNGEPAVLNVAEASGVPNGQTRYDRLKNSLTHFREHLPSMRCLGCRRGGQKARSWMEESRGPSLETGRNGESTEAGDPATIGTSRCDRIWSRWKNASRCSRVRECKCCRRASRIAPAESTSCCPPERRCGALCGRLFACGCCKCERSETRHTRSIRAKHSLTSVAPPPLSEEPRAKIPEVLVEHNSVMRGAIPCLPVPIAWFCLIWNVLLPGSGTIWSGLFNLCIGQPRFSISAGSRARFGALVVNVIVGVSQFFTVLFCLVGWGWSIWWGVTMIRLARKYKRYRASEAVSSDLEARGEQTGLPAGVPSQALRGVERAR